ncbi:MAG: beta-lactamase family protein [Anaerolineae bacterium]|nr:beta-lactamase family protein [Anaerolineae bacterium]
MTRYTVRILILVFLAILPLSACGRQQTVQPGTLDEFTEQLDTMLPGLLQEYRVPGAAVALVHNGEVAWVQGYGLANEDTGTPVTAETVFQVASISKSVTAWGVMRLVEEGRIDLDAPVEQYLTSWHLPPSEFDHGGVTVRRLLSHTAGLAPWDYPGTPVGETPPTLVELLSGMGSDEPVYVYRQPGEREKYSNGGYTLLQLLIKDVTGEPFAEYMQREVLTPLGMQHCAYQWLPELHPSTATGYEVSGQPVEHRSYPEAAGGLYSTATDIATWLAAGMSSPNEEPAGRKVLQPQTVALMYTPVLVTEKNGNGLGYVIETLPNGIRMVLHSGDVLGWRGQYIALPDQRSGVVVLTNSNAGRYVIADAICNWIGWTAGDVPKVCQIYQTVYVAIPIVAGIVGLGVVMSIWRLVTQIRSNQRKLVWPPKSDGQRRDIIFSLVAIVVWWLFVAPQLGLLLPPSFNWVTLAYTLWCLVTATKGLTIKADELT